MGAKLFWPRQIGLICTIIKLILASFLPHGWFNPTLQASDSELEKYDNYTFIVFAKSYNFFETIIDPTFSTPS